MPVLGIPGQSSHEKGIWLTDEEYFQAMSPGSFGINFARLIGHIPVNMASLIFRIS